MVILMNLMCLLLQMLLKIKLWRAPQGVDVARLSDAVSWAFPMVLMATSYVVEGNADGSKYQVLNNARHGVSCSMRFKSGLEERLLLWFHFAWICGGIIFIVYSTLNELQESIRATYQVAQAPAAKADAQTGSNSRGHSGASSQLRDSIRRLCVLATFVGVLQVTNMTCTLWTSSTLDTWAETSLLWLQCKDEEPDRGAALRDWDSYDLEDGQVMCVAGTERWSRSKCTSDCVYNASTVRSARVVTDLNCGRSDEYADAEGALKGMQPCDCHCDDIAKPQPPPLSILCFSSLAQSCVACVVGLSLGFRKANLDVWRAKKRSLSHPTPQASSNAKQVWNSKAYEEE